MNDPQVIGYTRLGVLGLTDQADKLQLEELRQGGAERIFYDRFSKPAIVPGWTDCVDSLRSGDLLIVPSIDRIGNDLPVIVHRIRMLYQKQINLRSLTENLDTRTPTGLIVFRTMAELTIVEHALRAERTMHGISKARVRGMVGSPKTYTDEQISDAMNQSNFHYEKAANLIGASKLTMIRRWKAICAMPEVNP